MTMNSLYSGASSSGTGASDSENASSMTTAPSPVDDHGAILGMACRVPGASSPSKLWDNIVKQRDLQSKMPKDRFDVDAFYHPEGSNKGTTNAKYGYFLDQDLGLFDAGFFNISGKEAEAMDPQQRLLLEVVYEALENAGITLDEIRGSQTSVFCGCFTNDYNAMTTKDLEHYPKYTVTGTGNSILSNRISYFYDLHGPSVTLDTACSSSLVAFHMGNQSLRTGEADVSIVVGSALHFDPNIFVTMTDLGMLSADGRCRHGDAAGSGYVRGEGVVALILKRKSRAQLDGNGIRAIVRGAGINHDGKKQGITLPSEKAQADLIERTYRDAGLDPAETQYVECHGTGTKAGDPRELRAIKSTFTKTRDEPLMVGSIKTNIGHLEGASGLAGVMKATMALERQQIPPNMHFNSPNSEVDFKKWKLQIPTAPVDWGVEPNVARRVSVNSFGYGGANAHIILEEYSPSPLSAGTATPPARLNSMASSRPSLAPLTSHSEKAGKLISAKFASYLEDNQSVSVADFALTLSVQRTMHPFRSFAIGSTLEAVVKNLQEPLPVAKWTNKMSSVPRLGFVFTGQGAQWYGMGRQLLEQNLFFRQTLERCDDVLQGLPDKPDWSVVGELLRSQSDTRLAETRFSQPICTALQLALVDLLALWGIKPSAVVGHSSGELAASYAAGILSFGNAMVAAFYRGLYMGNGAESEESLPGAMLAIGMTETEAVQELKPYTGRIAIAAMNSPSSFTVSGDEDAVAELQGKLTERKVFARRLQVSQAFHSHHMHPLAPGYERALKDHPGFAAESPTVRMFSSVTARLADTAGMGPAYFAANMTGTVKFADALTGTVLDEDDQQNVDILVEIGPHPALKGPCNQTLDNLGLKLPYIGTLDRKAPAYDSILSTAGQLFAVGFPVDLHAVNQEHYINSSGDVISVDIAKKISDFPSYAWDHQRYWAETRVIKSHRLRQCRHPILGAPMPGTPEDRPTWRNYLRISEMPWLTDHTVAGKVLFPGAGFVNMAVEAAVRLHSPGEEIGGIFLRDISVKSALVLNNNDVGTEVLLQMRPATESAKTVSAIWNEFTILSYEGDAPREHCTGLIQVEKGTAKPVHRIKPQSTPGYLRSRSERSLSRDKYYQRLHSIGLEYGPTFQLLSGDVECGSGFATAPVTWKPDALPWVDEDNASILHPTFLDASIHPIFAAIEGILGSSIKDSYVPTFIRSLTVSGLLNQAALKTEGFTAQTSATTRMNGTRVAVNDVLIERDDGQALVDIEGLELTSLGGDTEEQTKRSLFFGTQWKPAFDIMSSGAPNTVGSIAEGMELYVHQHPNSRILHYSRSLPETEEVLGRLGGVDGERRKFSEFVIVPPEAGDVSDFGKLVDRWDGLVRLADDIAEDKFDAILVCRPTKATVQDHVEEKGLIITHAGGINTEGLQMMWSINGVTVWKKAENSLPSSSSLTILMPENASSQTTALANKIESASPAKTIRKPFLSLVDDSNIDENSIVLYSLDNDYLFESVSTGNLEFKAAQALLTNSSRNVVWLTQGGMMEAASPEQAIVLGLARSARSENENLRLVVFDIEKSSKTVSTPEILTRFLDGSVDENEIAERNGQFYIPRIVANDTLNAKIPNGVNHHATTQPLYQQDRPLALRIGRPGLLETLSFADDLDIRDKPLDPDDLEIEVKASALNFRDIAASIGMIDEYKLGDECAGIVIRKGSNVSDEEFKVGDRVVAWRPGAGAHQTIARNPASCCFSLGPMPFATAASIPLILTTAYYSLIDVARLEPNETVLIHSAAGGVGQMAIQVAQMVGANIIATVGSEAKRTLLKSTYGLVDEQILYSRDDSFVEGVYRLTGGKGVDVALNSLAGKLLHATWNCVAAFGRFVEIGKRDIHQNSKIDMDPFRRNLSFASVDLVTMFNHNRTLGSKLFHKCCQLVHDGKIKPIGITEVPYTDAQHAFRMLQLGTVAGKVVLVPGDNDKVLVQPSTFGARHIFRSDKTYLLVGGVGGLGRSLSQWMFRRGARKLAFLSRSGAERAEAKETVKWLEDRNVEVSVFKGDVTDFEAVKRCVESLKDTMAGLFQSAMVLQDGPLDKMTHEQWQKCTAAKIRGTRNLHMVTSDLNLDFFVCFSSVSGVLGSRGQANYSAANNYLDSLCRHRRGLGLPASTMDIGMVVGVGAVSEDARLQTIMERIGYDAVNEDELFAQIEFAVTSDQFKLHDNQGFDGHQSITGVNLRRSDYFWSTEPRFRNLYLNHDFSNSTRSNESKKSVMAQLRAAKSEDDRIECLTDAFIDKIATILSVDKETVLPGRSLADYGLDSIVAIEIRKWFFSSVGVELALFDVLGSTSIKSLITKVVGLLSLEEPEAEDANQDATHRDGDPSAKPTASASQGNSSKESLFKVEDDIEVPMSSYQSRLWFVHNLAEDPSFLNLPFTMHIKGKPEIHVVRQALEEVKRRNEVLRTAYFEGDSFSQQMVTDNCSVDLPLIDLAESEMDEYVKQQTREVLDIEEGEIMRASMVRHTEDNFSLVLIFHHISVDRGSSKSFLEQLTTIYDRLVANESVELLKKPPVSYAEFTMWHNDRLESATLQKDVEFWKSKYEDKPDPSKLLHFAATERPGQNDYKRNVHHDVLNKTMHQRMKRICSRLGITPAQFLIGAFRAFLYRHTEEEDLTIHMIDGNRPHPAVNDTVGFFVNMVPVRCATTNNSDFETLLHEIHDRVLESLEHSQVPFDMIVDAVGAKRSPAYFPLGQVVVNYQMHGKMPTYSTRDFTITNVTGDDIPTACELNLEAIEDPSKGLKLRLEYSSTLYRNDDMDRFLDNFVTFMTSAIRDHRQTISDIAMVGAKELDHLKTNFFSTQFVENSWNNESIVDRIMSAAQQYPDSIAIDTSDGERVTYRELVNKARVIAAEIREKGILPGSKVGVLTNPGVHAISAMVGCLIAGCGYVALDPNFASERLAFMVSDSGVKLVLTENSLAERTTNITQKMSSSSPDTVVLDSLADRVSAAQAITKVGKNDPFYMVYTSGSTGKPKGVVLSQSNTQQMLSTLQHDYHFTHNDRFLHHSSICFDLSIVQIFSALSTGARVCVASPSTREDPLALASYMESSEITVTYFTPTQFSLLLEHSRPSLQNCQKYRLAYFAGERLPVRVAKSFYDLGTPAVALNTWSPSELVVQTTIQRVEYPKTEDVSIPIGFPMANTRHYILDTLGQPLPAGLVGEIVVGGAQVGLGYLNRPEANEKSFISDPFCSEKDRNHGWTRMFRSGDKGRFRPDGSLEFHGRIAGDKQIKLRGFRVDLGEVEQRLFTESMDGQGRPQIVDISVVARSIDSSQSEHVTDERQLIAFVVPKQPLVDPTSKQDFAVQVHHKGGKHLNSYMLPNGYQFLDAMPVTIGGKVNRQKLLSCELSLTYPTQSPAVAGTESQSYTSNTQSDKVMEAVLKAFREVLKLPTKQEIGENDSFFKLGGQSILMLRLQAKLKRALKVSPTLSMMFERPTPTGVAQAISGVPDSPNPETNSTSSDNAIDWSKETALPDTIDFNVPQGRPNVSPSDITDLLITGVDSFLGIHMLATVLRTTEHVTVHVLGMERKVSHSDIISALEHYRLLQLLPRLESVRDRVLCVQGSVASPHFGLSPIAFSQLGKKIQSIYHLGSRVSLLQSYEDFRPANVSPVKDVVHLATLGEYRTQIHHLSTWSVPHLHSWETTTRTTGMHTAPLEITASNFTPEPSNRYGYFKSRWAAEALMDQAAVRGVPVTVYRSSAITASRETGVPEPEDDFTRSMILGMIDTEAIPKVDQRGLEFAVDFVPVDYMTRSFHALAGSTQPRDAERGANVYHLCNPSPLTLSRLPDLIQEIKSDPGARVKTHGLGDWLDIMRSADNTADAEIRWNVLKGYFDLGHVMFSLDTQKTAAALTELGVEGCAPIDSQYLREVFQRQKARASRLEIS